MEKQDFFDSLQINGVSRKEILELASKYKFMKRKPKKIDPYDFLCTVCFLSIIDTPSFNTIAAKYSAEYSLTASKQAISKKMRTETIDFFKSILELLITSKFDSYIKVDTNNYINYSRVIVQDSTIIKLPLRLFDTFSGVKNQVTSVCNARIQSVFDLISKKMVYFSIDPYYKNDLSSAHELEICKGDLVLRDRGYFIYDEVQRHLNEKADCIYRYKTGITLLNPETDEVIDIYNLLKKEKNIDMYVCLNNKARTKVRLIASPVNDSLANERRRKAKKNTMGRNPSEQVLKLLSWTIFITTIPKEKADVKAVFEIYSLRWSIEIIFKAWKSHSAFDKIHNMSEKQLKVILFARFIMIVIITNFIYARFSKIIFDENSKYLSLLKLFNYISKNSEQIYILLSNQSDNNKNFALQNLTKYCTYDNRKRYNSVQIFEDYIN